MTPSLEMDGFKNGYIASVLASPKQPLLRCPLPLNHFFVLTASSDNSQEKLLT